MKKIFNKSKERKGFTLIELIVVIAILGILVLLSLPKFLGHTEKAQLAQIANDVKAHDTAISLEIAKDNSYTDSMLKNWSLLDSKEFDVALDQKKIFNERGAVQSSSGFSCEEDKIIAMSMGQYELPRTGNLNGCLVIPDNYVNTKLPGKFIFNLKEEVVLYIHNSSLSSGSDNGNSEVQEGVLACNENPLANPASDFTGEVMIEEEIRGIVQGAVEEGMSQEEADMVIEIFKDRYDIQDYIGDSKDVIIPCEIDGYKVVINMMSAGAFSDKELTSIVFPDTLNYIGMDSFKNNNLETVVIPDSVQEIESSAFAENNIKSLVLGKGVKAIHSHSFYGSLIETLTLPASLEYIDEYAFQNNDNLKTVRDCSNVYDVSETFDPGVEILPCD